MNRMKYAIVAVFIALLTTAGSAWGQAKSETTKPDRASVLLRFERDAAISASCSQTVGVITQSLLQVEGVKNAKIDAKNNGFQVSYDAGQTTPRKIIVAFNKENPDTLLRLADAKQAK
jgi:hypothetical protein